MIYECGENPIGHAWYNFNPSFYLIALVFVIFEVEIAFMFPVASVYKWFLDRGQGLLAFAEIFVFIAILAVGLAYVWAMGDLEWVKGLKQDVIKAAREKADAARKAAYCRSITHRTSARCSPRGPPSSTTSSTWPGRAASSTCSSASPAAASS